VLNSEREEKNDGSPDNRARDKQERTNTEESNVTTSHELLWDWHPLPVSLVLPPGHDAVK
jgi:hypothetical protein